MGLVAGVTGRHGMLTLPRNLTTPLVYPEIRVCPILKFVFPTRQLFVIYAIPISIPLRVV
jgi:hypothetical protein